MLSPTRSGDPLATNAWSGQATPMGCLGARCAAAREAIWADALGLGLSPSWRDNATHILATVAVVFEGGA